MNGSSVEQKHQNGFAFSMAGVVIALALTR